MELILLDGRRMTDRDSAHRYLKSTLRLPSYYGSNLDALADSLSELSNGVYVILFNIGDMTASLGEYGDALLTVFEQTGNQPHGYRFLKQED